MHRKSFLPAVAAILAVGTLAHTPTTFATTLTVGDLVTVGDANGNPFTPSTVPADPNGLHTNVAFQLNGGSAVYASAGLFVLNYTHDVPSGPSSVWTQFLSFCLEPDVYLTPFSNPYSVQTVGGAGYDNAAISELWGRYRSTVDTDLEAAAFQVALWELAYGSSDRNVATGSFMLTSPSGSVGTLAQSWLNSLNGLGPMASGLVVLVNDPSKADRQDLITQVPEPGTLALLGLGLIGIGVTGRRRRHG